MKRRSTLIRFLEDKEGATAIEYGLIAALISTGCIVALEATGSSLSSLFTGVNTKIDAKKP